MTTNEQHNKEFIINHFEEFVNRKNAEIAFQNMRDDFLDHDEASGPVVGPTAAMEMMKRMYLFIPDLHVSVEDIIAEGDKVMVRNIWSGTTVEGKRIQFKGFVLWRLQDGKIAERWATVTPPSILTGNNPSW